MGRPKKTPGQLSIPVPLSKKQLIDKEVICKLMGGISTDTLDNIRNDRAKHFPAPLQIVDGKLMWSVDQFERYIARHEKQVEGLSA